MINRVTYTGDLGYEIWVKPEYQRRLYDKVMEAGEEFGIVNFGMRALLSMRLEKNWPTWYRELRPIYGPFEADAGRFVDLKKNDFIGREAAAREKEDGGKLRRVTFVVDAGDADVLGDEPIWHDGKVVGWVTSGGYAHYVDRSLAQGYVPKELAGERRRRLRDRDSGRAAPGAHPGRAAVRSGRGADAGVAPRLSHHAQEPANDTAT